MTFTCWTSEPPLPLCNAAWCPLYHVKLFHLDFMMLSCLIFSVLCYAAGPSLPQAKVLDVPLIMLRVPIIFQDAALSDLNHLMLRRFDTLHTSCCLEFFIIMLLFSDCLILSLRCYAVWSSLPHASLLDLNSFMLFGFRLNTSCMLPDLGFMRLDCWILSFSCYAAWSSLPPVMLLDLLSITSDLTFTVPRCLMVSTSCYGTEPSQQYVILLDGPYFMLW